MPSNGKTPAQQDQHSHDLRLSGDSGLSQSLITALNDFCDRVEDAADDRVAVIHLDGRSPGESRAWPGDIDIHSVNRWERALRRVERLGAVTVAVLEGRCTGVALDVLLAADHRIAASDLRLTLPVRSGQFWPGMALHRLANQIGTANARRLLLRSSEVDAERAAALGVVDEIATDAAAAVRALRTIDGPEFAIRRRLILDSPNTSFEDALGVHLSACDRALRQAQRDKAGQPDPLVMPL